MRILVNEPMSRHTTYQIGGPADRYIVVNTIDELRQALLASAGQPIFVLGNGSNLIVRDHGIRGTVIQPAFADITAIGSTVRAQAGATGHDLIQYAIRNHLTGLECIAGIPGRLGGLICMNAGYTAPISTLVRQVAVMDYDGHLKTMFPDELQWGYRKSIFQTQSLIVVSADLHLKRGDCREAVKRLLRQRASTQPIQYPSCGSVFLRNGLKAYQGYGNDRAQVRKSFIVNLGGAYASDVLSIIDHVQGQQQVTLEAEIVGEL